ncbi:MerR family transcriptional regulator [Thalassolituus sp. LLYu03]|uniref:MerR family transcriptional regulator n=1 Tax=Thalassolituus sp. LLYu03 TaxID=3421656 RepID=UPI003D298A93
MYIGEFCRLTGATPKAIRHYEALGLIPEASRVGRYRVYDDTYAETVRQIRLGLRLGFSLAEFQQLTCGADIRRGLPGDVLRKAVTQKLADIEQQIAALNAKADEIKRISAQLHDQPCS